jgi:hypothetical protein
MKNKKKPDIILRQIQTIPPVRIYLKILDGYDWYKSIIFLILATVTFLSLFDVIKLSSKLSGFYVGGWIYLLFNTSYIEIKGG